MVVEAGGMGGVCGGIGSGASFYSAIAVLCGDEGVVGAWNSRMLC